MKVRFLSYKDCNEHAKKRLDMDKCFQKYIELEKIFIK